MSDKHVISKGTQLGVTVGDTTDFREFIYVEVLEDFDTEVELSKYFGVGLDTNGTKEFNGFEFSKFLLSEGLVKKVTACWFYLEPLEPVEEGNHSMRIIRVG
jgi:hypothetical protein